MYDGEFLCDSIDAEWGREGIKCGKVAPDSVATESILFYGEGDCGYGLLPCLLRMIMDKHWFILDIIRNWLWNEEDDHHLKLNQCQQLKKEEVLYLVVVYHDYTIIHIIFNCALAVL